MNAEEIIPFSRAELDQSVVARFARVAAEYGDRPAVVGNQRGWTYAEADRRTDQIAHAILQSVAPGHGCVAYLVDHSPEMVLCALGVMKTAKAYLCIHPGLPITAQRESIDDARPDLMLCDAAHEAAARQVAGSTCGVCVLEGIDEQCPDVGHALTIQPHDPAAIFYTSGSTGRPKGVLLSQRAVLHRAWLAAQYDRVSVFDRQSLLTYCSFASSQVDVFGALLNGASLHVFDISARSLGEFGEWIDAQRITLLHPPVVLFRRYLATLEGKDHHPSVRLVALAGETVVASDVEKWRQRFSPSCSMRHRFSSTEAGHIAVACIEPGDAIESGAVPAPRPVFDKIVSVIGEQGREVEAGQTGELQVNSAFLSDGYWRRAPNSANGFHVDVTHPGQRIFRTGDLGRISSDGTIELLGRRDDQVKIRGYRVELREVENALLMLPGVKEAAVIAEHGDSDTQMYAFIVADSAAVSDASAVRIALTAILPIWKIPSQINLVEELPLTLTGKIDRQRLLESRLSRPTISTNAATTDVDATTTQLLSTWSDVLRNPGVGIDDHFFDLGGHSLLAIEVMHHIKLRFGRSLPVSMLYEAPTVRRLAEVLRLSANIEGGSIDKSALVVTMKPGGSLPPLFFLPGAGRSALSYLPLIRLLDDRYPAYAFQYTGKEITAAELGSVPRMAERLAKEVRRLCPAGPYYLCGYSFGAPVAYELARQLDSSGHSVGLLAIFDGVAPGSRSAPPLHQRLTARGRAAVRQLLRPVRSRLAQADLADETRQANGLFDQAVKDANVRAGREYRPKPYAGRLTLFRAAIQSGKFDLAVPQPFNGWDAYCDHIDVRPVDGDHQSMLHDANLKSLARQLNECLAQPVREV